MSVKASTGGQEFITLSESIIGGDFQPGVVEKVGIGLESCQAAAFVEGYQHPLAIYEDLMCAIGALAARSVLHPEFSTDDYQTLAARRPTF